MERGMQDERHLRQGIARLVFFVFVMHLEDGVKMIKTRLIFCRGKKCSVFLRCHQYPRTKENSDE